MCNIYRCNKYRMKSNMIQHNIFSSETNRETEKIQKKFDLNDVNSSMSDLFVCPPLMKSQKINGGSTDMDILFRFLDVLNNKIYLGMTIGETEWLQNMNIATFTGILFKNNQMTLKSTFTNKLFISHVFVPEPPRHRFTINRGSTPPPQYLFMPKQISCINNNDIYFLHNGEYTNVSHTDSSRCVINLTQINNHAGDLLKEQEKSNICKNNEDIIGKFVFGIYCNKKGYVQCALLDFNMDDNKITVQTLYKKFIIDFMDTYFIYSANKSKATISFAEVYPNELYCCHNLNKSAFIQLHEQIPYYDIISTIKNMRKKYLSDPNIYTKYMLDTYNIVCDDGLIFVMKPLLFGHLVCHDSILCNIDSRKRMKNVSTEFAYQINMDASKLQIFFNYLIRNKLPKLYELIENRLVENIMMLKNLCDYFNIRIYLDYFNMIIEHECFPKLFVD